MWTVSRLRLAFLRDAPVRRALSTHRSRGTQLGPRGSINRPKPIQPTPKASQPAHQPEEPATTPTDAPNPSYDPAHNTLLSPVHIPEDPNAVLKENHPATNLLANSGLVVQRQLEMMTVMVYVYYSFIWSSMSYTNNSCTAVLSKPTNMSLWTRKGTTSDTWLNKRKEYQIPWRDKCSVLVGAS